MSGVSVLMRAVLVFRALVRAFVAILDRLDELRTATPDEYRVIEMNADGILVGFRSKRSDESPFRWSWPTGDAMFDAEIDVVGSAVETSRFNGEVRAALLSLSRQVVDLELDPAAGVLRVKCKPSADPSAAMRRCLDLFARQGSAPDRLAKIVTDDREPAAVRRSALATLLSECRDTPQAGEIARRFLHRGPSDSRVRAAAFLGAEGEATLEALAVDPGAGEDVREEALSALGDSSSRSAFERLRDVVVPALASDPSPGLRAAVARQIGRFKSADLYPTLCGLLDDVEIPVARAAADALADAGMTDVAEPRLIARLAGTNQDDVVIGLAEALGNMGTARSVEELARARDRRPGRRVQRAVQSAIDTILARTDGVAAGQVALAEPVGAAGDLSIADPQSGAGEVAIEDEAGGTPPV